MNKDNTMEKDIILKILFTALVVVTLLSVIMLTKYSFSKEALNQRISYIESSKKTELELCAANSKIWEVRANNNLNLVKAYFDDISDQYSYVVFNMSDCTVYQAEGLNYEQVICNKDSPLFAQTN